MDKTSKQKVYIERDRNGLYGLHVSNIAPDLNEEDLRELFHTSGHVKVCKLVKISDEVRVAFIKFESHIEASNALVKLNGAKIGDCTLEVRPAYESRWKAPRFNKEKTSDSPSKQESLPTSSSSLSEVDKKHSKEKLHQSNSSHINREENSDIPGTYTLPAASQDARYSCNGSSSSSLASSTDKTTSMRHSTFNNVTPFKEGKDSKTTSSENESSSVAKTQIAATSLTRPVKKMSLTQPKKPAARSPENNVLKWSVDDVAGYFLKQEECSTSMITFIREQEIDGNALMLIKENSLLHFMKLGPALKFLNLKQKLES